jgi:hypothetical protein
MYEYDSRCNGKVSLPTLSSMPCFSEIKPRGLEPYAMYPSGLCPMPYVNFIFSTIACIDELLHLHGMQIHTVLIDPESHSEKGSNHWCLSGIWNALTGA